MSEALDKLSWDDLRIIKAIGECNSQMGAADALGINHSTVSRRLSAMESTLGVVLFDRRRNGYVATAAGADMIALANRVEKDVLGVARRVSEQAQRYKGDLLITTSDALLVDFLTPIIAEFQACHPGIRIEVIVSNQPLNLARGDSDIALRATLAVPENLFGRKVALVAWATYGRLDKYAGGTCTLDTLHQSTWVSYGKGLSSLKAYQFIDEHVPRENIIYRSDSVYGVAAAIRAGIGIGLLPCMHGDLVPDLVRIGPVEPEVYDELWLLTHPDIRKSERIYAFMTHCADAIVRQRAFIEGHGAPGTSEQ
ncbi:LysR family transcriptional regulator [Pseudomonas guariconensis]|uniref:LysR family transcriptional regulator n=1 Tax=Pseudomonas TaxID=286 RepID=UPI001CE3E77B|nr:MULTISPECIES: LysR family transcriptional regulator [Pseudomonas]MCO7638750.1 LysR family transcriptional regulator [Pseudomonas sp. S 311-6]MCO7514975.1 LysR family transcriptional regulator [Pseudomonas putida]MCO7564471.1 LysR family transcriptional regulator [Pseudomonas mosselii]MCO7595293.1 LysR family transcriptional regulator [Pseudomonas guariconensis]MCO7604202.1 LysR family transcriptional regulator [Pseudomonas guariconensis]